MSAFIKVVIGCVAVAGFAWLALILWLASPLILEKFAREDLTGLTPEQIMYLRFHQDAGLHHASGSISDFLEDAEQGDPGAQLNLAHRYDMGMDYLNRFTNMYDYDAIDPANRDICLMRYWHARAARENDPAAMSQNAWTHGWGLFSAPDPKLSFLYLLKWGEMRGYTPEQIIPMTINLDNDDFDPTWLKEFETWSPSDVPLPPKASCVGCPMGEADNCLADSVK